MKKLLFIGALTMTIVACKKDMAPAPTCVDEISYAADIKPIIETNCSTSGCHDATALGGYNLVSHNGVAANADIILNVINHETGFTPMPMGGSKLPDSVIQNFSCWIQQGTQNN